MRDAGGNGLTPALLGGHREDGCEDVQERDQCAQKGDDIDDTGQGQDNHLIAPGLSSGECHKWCDVTGETVNVAGSAEV